MVALFWTCALAAGYAWAIHPLLLVALGRRRPRPPIPARGEPRPRLSVVVAAFDEAAHIAAKLRSTLQQCYPADRLEVIVVSDGSTDATDAIVAAYPDPRVRLVRQDPRAGKARALNRGVAAATGDVLVFTDANAAFAPHALARLATPFADPATGLVSGLGLYRAGKGDARAAAGGYVRLEARLKSAESTLGFLASADGAIYALRRELYRDLADADVNDLLHPIQVALAGRASRFEPEACTMEPSSRDAGQEFRRHVRIVAQGARLLRRWLPRLVAARRWRAVWLLAAHRVLRWSTGLFLGGVLVADLALLGRGAFYRAALAAQLGFYALAAAGLAAERRGVRLGPLALPYYFCVVSAAGVTGLARGLGGGADAVWAPAGRRDPSPAARADAA